MIEVHDYQDIANLLEEKVSEPLKGIRNHLGDIATQLKRANDLREREIEYQHAMNLKTLEREAETTREWLEQRRSS